MTVQTTPSSVWVPMPANWKVQLQRCIDHAVSQRPTGGEVNVYFRADDIAVPSRGFEQLLEIFQRHSVPLALAVVPTWLNATRWQALNQISRTSSALWCWHQHGWRHANHQSAGKKSEFGSNRPIGEIKRDLLTGKRRLEKIMGRPFSAIFTPPWNRCDLRTLETIRQLGYQAISRHHGSQPPAPDNLMDLKVGVDLHTRKEKTNDQGWKALLDELQMHLATGRCGIMIHHQRMNRAAMAFLSHLLARINAERRCRLVSFADLI